MLGICSLPFEVSFELGAFEFAAFLNYGSPAAMNPIALFHKDVTCIPF